MTWRQKTLGELCDVGGGAIKTGPFGSQLHESDYSPLGTPVVMPKDIIDGKVSEKSIARIAESHVDRLAHHQLRPGDIVFGRRGDIGRQALITTNESGWLCGTGCLRITLGRSELDPQYLHYYLRDEVVIEGIAQQAIGATMPNLNTSILRGIEIRFPRQAQQRNIASILSNYDELIENNTRRIAILEEMARRIYEEWFVRFRFPGHENVRMVESELGLVPEGWGLSTLKAVCVRQNGIQTGPFGSQLHKADYADEGVPLLMPKNLVGFRIRTDGIARVPEGTAAQLGRHRMQPGDIVYGRRGDIGRRAYIMTNQTGWLCGTGCLRIRSDPTAINGWYLFNFIGQPNVVGLITGRAHGVTMPNLNARLMESVPVLIPPRDLQDRFDLTTFPMNNLREKLSDQTQNLRITRDLLLPKLISGELDVSALPDLEAAAA